MKENSFNLIEMCVVVVLFSLLAFCVGAAFGEFGERQKAIQANVAEHQINPKTGETKFVYLNQTK